MDNGASSYRRFLEGDDNGIVEIIRDYKDGLPPLRFVVSYQDLPLTLTAPEVGEVLGISRASAYELVRSKGFPHMKIGTRILVPRDKFLAWIDQQTEVEE